MLTSGLEGWVVILYIYIRLSSSRPLSDTDYRLAGNEHTVLNSDLLRQIWWVDKIFIKKIESPDSGLKACKKPGLLTFHGSLCRIESPACGSEANGSLERAPAASETLSLCLSLYGWAFWRARAQLGPEPPAAMAVNQRHEPSPTLL